MDEIFLVNEFMFNIILAGALISISPWLQNLPGEFRFDPIGNYRFLWLGYSISHRICCYKLYQIVVFFTGNYKTGQLNVPLKST